MKKINRIIKEEIENIFLNEVRYIDTKYSNKKGEYKQEPIKNDEKIRVFHGCNLETAVQFAIQGVSGKEFHPRRFSYESGMNPIGLFVSTSFDEAKEFAYIGHGNKENEEVLASVVVEFTANSNDLDTPVWNGQNGFFGQGSNPQPFNNKEERLSQKAEYTKKALQSPYEHVKNSDNPALADRIFNHSEHQALFFGDLSPNMIKRFWVMRYDENHSPIDKTFIPMNRKMFLKKYGGFKYNIMYGYANYNAQIKQNKLYLPSENYNGIDDFIKRMIALDEKMFGKENDKSYFLNWCYEILPNQIKDIVQNNEYYKLEEYMWPKQIMQLVGKENYSKYYDKLGLLNIT